LQTAKTSVRRPTQSLKPTGFAPESSRSFAMNASSPRGESKAECAGGEMQVSETGLRPLSRGF